jgi:acetoacetate decarboxylase
VDSDTSLARGWIQGFPKVFGDVAMTRPVEVGRAGVRRQTGATFRAHLSEHGTRLCTVSVRLTQDSSCEIPRAVGTPLLLNRVFPSLDGTGAVDRLVHNRVADVELGRVLTGPATIAFGGGDHEIGLLAPTGHTTHGAVFPYGFSIVGSKCVEAFT